MSNLDFAHLHIHSQYSILDGAIQIGELCDLVKKFGMSSVALTDHGVMSGAVELQKAAKKRGIKPIFGCELYITLDSDGLTKNDMNRDNYHLCALAMNQQGYENLLWLVSNAHLKNFYYKPRVSQSQIEDHSEGLIVLSGCINGQCFRYGHYDPERQEFSDPEGRAAGIINWYRDVFGDRYYFEIQDAPDLPQQAAYNTWLLEQGKKLGIKPVITADAHYLTQAHKGAHDVLMAMQTKKTLDEYLSPENEFKFGPYNYVRDSEKMLKAAVRQGSAEAFENTLEIAERCKTELELGEYKPPVYDIDQADDKEEFEKWLEEGTLAQGDQHRSENSIKKGGGSSQGTCNH